VEEILGHVLTETEYRRQYETGDSEQAEQRLANIDELLTAARRFDERHAAEGALEAFLEQTALVSETDHWEPDADRVTLMTLHASKGLEFPVVFLVAVEEGLLPHERCRDHPEQLEEERRLMFVGITRAQEELEISMACYRDFRGRRRPAIPSSFLMELPRAEMELVGVDEQGRQMAFDSPVYDAGFVPAGAPADVRAEDVAASGQIDAPSAALGGRPSTGDGTKPAVSNMPPGVRLTTAAQLAGQQSPAPSPDDFHHGMLVMHAELGLGRVVALSGAGAERTATVDFISPPRRCKFRLLDGALRPVEPRA